MSGIPSSDHFKYVDGALTCDGVSLETIAQALDTPSYVYSAASIAERFRAVDEAMAFTPHLVAYAVKANGNLAILSQLAALGAGADLVSEGELARALEAGFSPDKIVFSGVGKRRSEITRAIELGIKAIHVESASELRAVADVARTLGTRARVVLRVNPNVDPQTHPYIATGLHGSKFGIEIDVAERLVSELVGNDAVSLVGVACHIGSQLGSPDPLREAITLLGQFAKSCIAKGHALTTIDVGGGWPLDYGHEAKPYPGVPAFGAAIREGLEASGVLSLGLTVVTEPGRSIVGDSGVLLTRVVYVKDQGPKRFVVVDAAMTELIRPSLYGAYHAIMPLRVREGEAREVDVVGPVCESGDFLAKARTLPPVEEGDLLAIRGAGAYGREMSMTYNGRPHAAEAMVRDGAYSVVRRRGTIASLWDGERT
jgi:diaminopimelate decarboxylase